MFVHSVLPSQAAVHRRMVELGGLRAFTELAFPLVEPRAFVPNWHIDAICDHLQGVTKGEIRNLIINVPPGCMKSLAVSVMWPAWTWTIDPAFKWIFASYSGSLTRRDALRSRNLINSAWFQERWGFETDPFNLRPNFERPNTPRPVAIPWQNTRAAMFYENNHKGFRFSTSVGGEVTGRHADGLVIDDPNKAQAATGGRAATGVELKAAVDFWGETMATRQADPKRTRKVIIMQRLHEKDLAGAMLETGDYTHLCLPMEFDPKRICSTVLGFRDPRTEQGALLWPDRFGPTEVRGLRRAMGSKAAAAQLDQDPTPDGGAIFKPEWLNQVWKIVPKEAQYYLSVDCAFKAETDSDYVVLQVWARRLGVFYLIHQVRARLDFPSTLQAILDCKAAYPKISGIYIEDKANGSAVISVLKKRIPGIKPVEPQGGKEARANGVAPYFEAGDIWLPPESVAPWIGEYRAELIKFPRAANDDQVDATTQILLELAGTSGNRLKAAMDAIKART